MRSCDLPAALTTLPRILGSSSDGKTNGEEKRTSYSVKLTKWTCGHTSRSNPSKSFNKNACESWRARSARKLKNKTVSSSRTRCSLGRAKISGGMNSSVLPSEYCAFTAASGDDSQNSPRPRTIASQFAIGDGLVNPGEVLINDPAGSEIKVANFRVSHLSLW